MSAAPPIAPRRLRLIDGSVCCPCARPGALRMPWREAATFLQLRCAGCATVWTSPKGKGHG